jgi:ABC-type amino acid transport substrate-binding protein
MNLKLSPKSIQVGDLKDKYDVSDLSQDLVQITLGTNYGIDIGWYPEHDVNGDFVIRVFYETFDNCIIEVKTKTVDYVRVIVEMFSKEFGL